MMSKSLHRWAAVALVATLASASTAQAAMVEYTATSLGGNAWRYDYTLNNSGAALSFDEFSVYFDAPGISALSVAAAPGGWSSLVVQPDPLLPDAGYFDALHLSGNVAAGSSTPGFSVIFSYLAGLTPGAQRFDLVTSEPFQTVSTGTTSLAPSAVPLPAGFALMLFGLCTGGALSLRGKRDRAGAGALGAQA